MTVTELLEALYGVEYLDTLREQEDHREIRATTPHGSYLFEVVGTMSTSGTVLLRLREVPQ